MSWRNRISIKGRAHGFRKMNSGGDEDYGMPLLDRSSSLSPRGNSGPLAAFTSPIKSVGSDERNINIAAVSDDVEALSFSNHKRDRSSSDKSPVSIVQDTAFVAQFDPEIMKIVDEKDDSASATVYDDNTSSDDSLYHDEDHEIEEIKSLRPPSIAEDEAQQESKDKDSTSKTDTESTSNEGGSNSRLSSSTRKKQIDNDEAPDAAAWKADEIDALAHTLGFGQPTMEISGVDLLTERDTSVNQLQEVNHLMAFNALVLIQKQKDWIEGSIDATKGANKGSSALIKMELENLERKIKLLMDSKSWPNERERKKQQANPFTPSKAFFKSMALIDKSIEQFHKGYLKYMSQTSQENHELKERVEKLVEVNASLQEQAERSLKKTEIIRKLQKEREVLTLRLDSTEQMLSSLLINKGSDSSSPNEELSSKIQRVKMYIQKLEMERNALETEILKLKNGDVDTSESTSEVSENDEHFENKEAANDVADAEVSSDINETGILNDDLASKWLTLEQNELKDEKIKSLRETVAGQESALAEVRAECKLMRTQLVQLENTRNEFKADCERKDSALVISQDRISSLEEEILLAHAKCAAYEEDYEAMRESFATQKVATKQEISNSQDEVKVQVERIREEYEAKLENSEAKLEEVKEDRDRVVRDLKASVEEIQAERDNLKSILERNPMIPIMRSHPDSCVEEEKKETDEEMYMDVPAVVSPKSTTEAEFDEMRNRFVEKASKQAFTIAQLTEENEIKDEQLKSLHEMVEMLLGNRNGDCEPTESGSRAWGKRISNLRSNVMNRRQHGSFQGSTHGEVTN